jgi:hypothetical protein
MRFMLGTAKPHWLEDARFLDVPLFVSRRTLSQVKKLPRAFGEWALDSGGFSELQMHGRWTISAKEYVAEVRRYRDEIGGLLFAAPGDWMCEPVVIHGGTHKGVTFAGTGLSVEEHQRRTVDNFLELRALAPDIPFIPVLQGWSIGSYWTCQELYDKAGVDLRAEPLVGVGTVCRRQDTLTGKTIIHTLAVDGLRLHGFGFKVDGLEACAGELASADSMAWSDAARHRPPLEGHDKPGFGRKTGHQHCNNCASWSLEWRENLLARLAPTAANVA